MSGTADRGFTSNPMFERWLAQRLAGDAGGETVRDLQIDGVERPAAGQSNDTVLFTATWRTVGGLSRRELVVRLQPSGRQIFLAADVVREGRVLHGLQPGGRVPVPHVLGWETDVRVLGRPFFVMDRIAGRVPLARPSIHAVGWLPELTSAERATMWDSAMEAMVNVHRTDWRATHAFLLDGVDPAGLLALHVDRLVEWYRWTTAGRGYPVTDAGIEALIAGCAAVSSAEPVLVWGDARVGNMIFGVDHRVAAVIDWEVATIGSPAI
ncbi:MAG: hypothetical protein JWM12_2311, partial [Ilumatobacteraceae bacterium]|nr:hypothetical protein [Ilumatobacteraceae bacterium]